MLDPHCAIRFTDPDHTVEAHVVRDTFGYPEDVLANLAELADVVTELPTPPSPRTVAAQFVVIDALAIGYQNREPEELFDALLALIGDEPVGGTDTDLGFLCHHSIEAVEATDESIWCYEVEIGAEDAGWLVHIGGPVESAPDTTAALFEDVSWQFDGSLADALAAMW